MIKSSQGQYTSPHQSQNNFSMFKSAQGQFTQAPPQPTPAFFPPHVQQSVSAADIRLFIHLESLVKLCLLNVLSSFKF